MTCFGLDFRLLCQDTLVQEMIGLFFSSSYTLVERIFSPITQNRKQHFITAKYLNKSYYLDCSIGTSFSYLDGSSIKFGGSLNSFVFVGEHLHRIVKIIKDVQDAQGFLIVQEYLPMDVENLSFTLTEDISCYQAESYYRGIPVGKVTGIANVQHLCTNKCHSVFHDSAYIIWSEKVLRGNNGIMIMLAGLGC